MAHRFASLRQLSVLLLLISKAAAPLESFAQQPAGAAGTLQLTLKQAVQLALKQNPQRVIAQVLMYENDRNSQIARSALLPHADIVANGSLNQYNVQSIARAAKPAPAGPSGDRSRPDFFANRAGFAEDSRIPDRPRRDAAGARRRKDHARNRGECRGGPIPSHSARAGHSRLRESRVALAQRLTNRPAIAKLASV